MIERAERESEHYMNLYAKKRATRKEYKLMKEVNRLICNLRKRFGKKLATLG